MIAGKVYEVEERTLGKRYEQKEREELSNAVCLMISVREEIKLYLNRLDS